MIQYQMKKTMKTETILYSIGAISLFSYLELDYLADIHMFDMFAPVI